MERRGVYRKGSAGHARNMNSYRYYRDNVQKWRLPVIALALVVAVFGSVSTVGDGFKASVLSVDSPLVQTAAQHPENVKKALLLELNSFTDACKKYRLNDCATAGNVLTERAVRADSDIQELLNATVNFESQFQKQSEIAACHFDLSGILIDFKTPREELAAFIKAHSANFPDATLASKAQALNEAFSGIDDIVNSCDSL